MKAAPLRYAWIADNLSREEAVEASYLAASLLSLAVEATREGADIPMCGDAAKAVEFANDLLSRIHDVIEEAPR
jgi:hypothetical protein